MRNHTHKANLMQPFPEGLRQPTLRWYTSVVPRPSPDRFPGPLDNLPRPLSERDRGGSGRRRLLALTTVAVVVAGVVGGAQMAGSVRLPDIGAIAGAIGTPAHTDPPAAGRTGNGVTGADSDAAIPFAAPDDRLDLSRVRAKVAPPPSRLSGYQWPLAHGRLTLPFGPTPWGSRIVDGANFHDGIDLATFCGDRVLAAHDGVVLAAGRHYDKLMGWVGDLGPYLRPPREEAPVGNAADRRRHR